MQLRATALARRLAIRLKCKRWRPYSAPDGPWIDAEADAGFYQALRGAIDADVPHVELAGNINDKEFADAVVERFFELWAQRQGN